MERELIISHKGRKMTLQCPIFRFLLASGSEGKGKKTKRKKNEAILKAIWGTCQTQKQIGNMTQTKK